ncbi:MAG TPA: hypothetical protein DEP46_16890 [Blastocatellia bacterium]|nr:hypothetical protein [Blastocatellia bacterium]
MQTTLTTDSDIPTALPDIEADEEREKMLLDDQNELSNDEVDDDELDLETGSERKTSRTAKVLKTAAAFTVFLFLMGTAITWFFGMGWFAAPNPQAVNRTSQKDSPPAPMTEDEKLKAALTMVAAKELIPSKDSVVGTSDEPISVDKPAAVDTESNDISSMSASPTRTEPSFNVGTDISSRDAPKREDQPTNLETKKNSQQGTDTPQSKSVSSIEPLGRSLFFGVTKVRDEQFRNNNSATTTTTTSDTPKPKISGSLPFGSLLTVRLIGAIYTLRNSGGVVRMELTQPVVGKGYSYPAGTTLIGNLRGGESVRAFVNIIGLIDPVSGELVKFTGELLGTDGASGIPGNRKRVTGKWTRFFRGIKDTAGSILGSVGSFRSGGTVVISEPLRRGSEKLSEDTSQSLFGNEPEDTFLEVLAGTTGYVLVTQLPEPNTSIANTETGAKKE